jgi:peptidoglycan/xylan/chitin deacetylase (PgdA/CDA1 family)
MSHLKSSLLRLLLFPGATIPFSFAMKGHAVVFMLHRFLDPDQGVEGFEPQVLRQGLAYLRKHRYELLPLQELFTRLAEGRSVDRAVVFTIDDGYLEQAMVAGPVFAEFDCPVTTFVTSGFLDGQLWFWWDQIEYIFSLSKRHELSIPFGEGELRFQWDTVNRGRAQDDFTEACKKVPETAKHEAVCRLAEAAEVDLPPRPPSRYLPMSWDQARACEERGMSFGPHTVTHPILARTSDAESRQEITKSWERLRSEVRRPVAVFCYPNGQPQDFTAREIATLEDLDFLGAVVGTPGYVSLDSCRQSPDRRFRVPRFGYPDYLPCMIQYVSGLERVKQLLRREVT